MAATPKKLVHWALDMSFSGFGSPFSDASSEASSTSSLQYINSQLIAHGFTHAPGLSLDGLSKDDTDRLVKCLLGMLSQRVDDMSRTEELSTKLRTLSYDHERMMSMYQAEKEKAANAEREMSVHKSRLASMTRTLQSTENAHKHTTAELQRTRTTLQAVRTAHQTEIKKLEKDKDRIADRWNKLSDVQLKLGTASSSMRCANAEIVDAADVQLRGKGKGFLELALEQAEQARSELFDQNRKLRGLILSTANEMQSIMHAARTAASPDSHEEPVPLSLSTLFQTSPTETAGDKLSSLLSSIRESISRLSQPSAGPSSLPSVSEVSTTSSSKPPGAPEVDRLQAVIDTLCKELEESQKQASAYALQTQALFDQFASDERLLQGDVGDMSVDLMTVPARDEEKERLEARFKELEDERMKFTEAAVRLGREKAALEAERIKFLEEKRSWQVELMLADLPPTPGPPSTSALTNPVREQSLVSRSSPKKSPRKSPRKVKAAATAVGKAGSGKKIRVSRRSSSFGIGLGPPSPRKITPPFETEVIPSPPLVIPAFKTSIAISQPQPPIAAPAFVLPPPSPAASLQRGSHLSSTLIPPLPPAFDIPSSLSAPSLTLSAEEASDSAESQPSTSMPSSRSAPEMHNSALLLPVPSTPVIARPFPMAKPLAAGRMIHAYSPAKPSPLSRILMLANSPESPDIDRPRLTVLKEDNENEDSDVSPTPAPPARSLAAELGISEDDESPLREKKVEPNLIKAKTVKPGARLTAKEKGKSRAEPIPVSRTRPAVALEKENVKRAKLSTGAPSMVRPAAQQNAPDRKSVNLPPKPFSRTNVPGKLPPGKGGARRVPIDSAEAAPVGPAWKS